MYHDLYPGTLCLLYLSKACGEEEALPMRGCKVNFVIFIIYFKCLQGKTRKKEKKKRIRRWNGSKGTDSETGTAIGVGKKRGR